MTYERASAPSDSLTLIVIYPRTGNLSNPGAAGIVEISDGTSTTFLVIERPPHLSCADINDNGLAGLTSVMLETREVPTGEPSAVSIIPVDGEIDEAGTEDAILLIVRGTTTIPIRGIKITLRVWDVQ